MAHWCSLFGPASCRTLFNCLLRTALAVLVLFVIESCAYTPKPGERVTGDCKVLVFHCSSRQVTLDLGPTQREAVARLQERSYLGLPVAEAVSLSADALRSLGFSAVSAEPRFGLLHAERDKVLATDAERRRRVLLPALISAVTRGPVSLPLLAGPDHESVQALVLARSDDTARVTRVRIQLDDTIFDSKGNSRTATATQSDSYDAFFRAFETAKGTTSAGRHADDPTKATMN
jgi:hypothetical protein